jgi:flavin reductase (DIM6/NTAB) family NADH-FMN oxidoreductase RutF
MSAPQQNGHSPIDAAELRRAFGTFVTGVTVVTTWDGEGAPRGMTANSFTSVSLDPPLLLVCIGRHAASFPAFSASTAFAVNLLHEAQTDVSSLFASKSPDKFGAISHDTVHTGAPVLTDCMTWFDCSVHDRVEAGDHMVLIGRVQAFGTSASAPLGFCRGRYAAVKDPLPAGWSPSHSMVVGYLIEHDGRILLRADGRGGWGLPTARRRRAEHAVDLDDVGALPLLSDSTFLYSVFDVGDSDPGYIIYRGRLEDAASAAALPPDLRFFAPEDLPFEAIPVREIRAMLRRYLRERSADRFGIYIDSSDGGRVAMIDGDARPWQASDA